MREGRVIATQDSALPVDRVAVAVIGAGPSGLTAAAALARELDGRVLVLERERETGGIPRHSNHLGYGIRDLHRFISGPAYARRLTQEAQDVGAELETEAQVTGIDTHGRLVVTSPRGRRIVDADAVVLATGARERPRAARRIPGDRPDGVYTTGELQNLVHLHHATVGKRAVIVGAELVSWSAIMTLREVGCTTVAMLSRYSRSESYAAFRAFGQLALRVPVATRKRIVRINGKSLVESVVVEDLDTLERTTIECDVVITTGDWIPDNELARLADLEIDRGTKGPIVDTGLRTSCPGMFAIGNLVHPVDTADAAALDGLHVVSSVTAHLYGKSDSDSPAVTVEAGAPFTWVSPQRIRPGERAPRGDLLLWPDEYHRFPIVQAWQDGELIGERRVLWPASPGRVFRVSDDLLDAADPEGGTVKVTLAVRRT